MFQLKDLYLMIAGNQEGCKKLVMYEDRYTCVGAQCSLGQIGIHVFRFYSEFNRKATQLMW